MTMKNLTGAKLIEKKTAAGNTVDRKLHTRKTCPKTDGMLQGEKRHWISSLWAKKGHWNMKNYIIKFIKLTGQAAL